MINISEMAQKRPLGLRCGFDELPRRVDMSGAVYCGWEMMRAHLKRGADITPTFHAVSLENRRTYELF